jgi:hypothetical protein
VVREHAQRVQLLRGQLARDAVDDAERAQRVAVFGDERRARVEADAGIGGDERVVAEALVAPRVRDDEQAGLPDGVRAEGRLARRLGDVQPDARLEPLAVVIDEADQGDGRLAELRREARDVVERLLGLRVEHAALAERPEPRGLVLCDGSSHEEVSGER